MEKSASNAVDVHDDIDEDCDDDGDASEGPINPGDAFEYGTYKNWYSKMSICFYILFSLSCLYLFNLS